MSRANAWIKFPDNKIKYAVYCGTTDWYQAPICDSLDEAWNLYYKNRGDYLYSDCNGIHAFEMYKYPELIIYPVELSHDYGGGGTHLSYATEKFILILEERNLPCIKDSLAEWVPK